MSQRRAFPPPRHKAAKMVSRSIGWRQHPTSSGMMVAPSCSSTVFAICAMEVSDLCGATTATEGCASRHSRATPEGISSGGLGDPPTTSPASSLLKRTGPISSQKRSSRLWSIWTSLSPNLPSSLASSLCFLEILLMIMSQISVMPYLVDRSPVKSRLTGKQTTSSLLQSSYHLLNVCVLKSLSPELHM